MCARVCMSLMYMCVCSALCPNIINQIMFSFVSRREFFIEILYIAESDEGQIHVSIGYSFDRFGLITMNTKTIFTISCTWRMFIHTYINHAR